MRKTIDWFDYEQAPLQDQSVHLPMAEVAHRMNNTLPDGPEKAAGMRKLLEARDCFVRASHQDDDPMEFD